MNLLGLVSILHRRALLRAHEKCARDIQASVSFTGRSNHRTQVRTWPIPRFAKAFEGWDTVNVPGVVNDLHTDAVLVQDMSGGHGIADPEVKEDGPRLAQLFIDAHLNVPVWYLLAWDRLRGAVRYFRIDRIKSVTPLEAGFRLADPRPFLAEAEEGIEAL